MSNYHLKVHNTINVVELEKPGYCSEKSILLNIWITFIGVVESIIDFAECTLSLNWGYGKYLEISLFQNYNVKLKNKRLNRPYILNFKYLTWFNN